MLLAATQPSSITFPLDCIDFSRNDLYLSWNAVPRGVHLT